MADSFLTRKIGPLPAWGWAAAGAGIYLVYRLRKQSSSSASSTTTTGGAAPSGYGDYLSGGSGGGQATLQTPGGFSYSGPSNLLTNPSLQSLFAGTGSSPVGAVAVTPGSVSPNYVALTSPQAVAADLASGFPVYQSAQEAQAYDLAHGTPPGQQIPTSGYFQLSGPAATGLAASGQPVYVQTS